jgi:hypothetical protein
VFGKGFVVAPVTTALQRRFLGGGPTLTAFVSVNADGLFPDDKSLDPEALDLKGIRAALAELKPTAVQTARLDTYLHLTRLPGPPRAGNEVVRYALEGVAVRAGFGKASASNTLAHKAWGEYIAPLRDVAGAGRPEDGVGDERAVAFLVVTPLSRVLTDRADGVVDVRTRLDGRAGAAVSPVVEFSALEALKGVGLLRADRNLPRSGRVTFLLDVQDRDDGTDNRLRELVQRWATRAGLESGAASY